MFAVPNAGRPVVSVITCYSMSGYIKQRDQKILWARAAGRCSLGECDVELTLDIDVGTATVGAMCHIVGENEGAARWRDSLTDEERNSYANLILLCSHHHDIIDNDESTYSIERLHQIKAEHENWVRETLSSAGEIDPDDAVYADLIDTLTKTLYLNHWTWFIENAVRNMLPEEIFDNRAELNRRKLGALFPERFPALDEAIRRVIDSYNEYVSHFETRSEEHRSGNFHVPDRSWKRVWDPERYKVELKKDDRWSSRNFWLLCDLVLRINEFCAKVQEHINPMFFRVHGRFMIIDSMGYRFNGRNSLYMPTEEDVARGVSESSPNDC